MLKYSGLLAGAVIAGWAVASSASAAEAHKSRHSCNCGPKTSKTYKTIHPASTVTRYRDVNVVKHVARIHRIVNVVRIQPIVRIHEVTRVHHHTVFYPQYTYANVRQNLPPIRQVTHSVIHTYDCRCGY